MLVVKSPGLRFDGSLAWGRVEVPDLATEELFFPDEPHPASARSRTAMLAVTAPARLLGRGFI
jgi:hypothetical protein